MYYVTYHTEKKCDDWICDNKNNFNQLIFQETAECLCKTNVEGENCDTCIHNTFDLQQMNPDGCTQCFCSGKAEFCSSNDRLVRTKVMIKPNCHSIHTLGNKILWTIASAWSKTTLNTGSVGGAGACQNTRKKRTCFIMYLTLTELIFKNF